MKGGMKEEILYACRGKDLYPQTLKEKLKGKLSARKPSQV